MKKEKPAENNPSRLLSGKTVINRKIIVLSGQKYVKQDGGSLPSFQLDKRIKVRCAECTDQ